MSAASARVPQAAVAPSTQLGSEPAGTQPAIDHRVLLMGTLGGILFGFHFVVTGNLVAGGWSFDLAAAHAAQPVLYIVDLAPVVLGITGWFLGRIHGRLVATRDAIEQTVELRTAELSSALDDLYQAQGQLLQAQKLEAIGSLAAGVAHEINTPIQYIGDNARFLHSSFAEIGVFHRAASELASAVRTSGLCPGVLERFDWAVNEVDLEFLEEEIPLATKQAIEGVERVAEIVGALKDFSHPGSGKKDPFDVNRAITSTLAVSKSEWKLVAEVTTDLDPNLPLVEALAGPVNQALLIIVVNAAQALEEKLAGSAETRGTIAITTRHDADCVTVSIRDDAGGIPEDVQDRVFDPFFTTKEVGKGSGQGLAIARSVVVEQHGGELTFEVEPGVGTTFHVRIPVRELRAEAQPAQPAQPARLR